MSRGILEYLQDIAREFDLNPDEFAPISTWFSYGSNLSRENFEDKMSDYGSNLTLVRARRSRLRGWTRDPTTSPYLTPVTPSEP